MSLPAAHYTRNKWLAFFAELGAKVSHHSIPVVLEGCELIRRLLLTRVSVAALLEEGHLLQHLCNAFGAAVGPQPPNIDPSPREAELVVSLLHALDLVVSMSLALHAERDPYPRLLVRARAVPLLRALWVGAQLPDRRHPVNGHAASLMLSLLTTVPLQAPLQPLAVPHGGNLARHIRGLEEAAARTPELLQSLEHEVALVTVRVGDDTDHKATLAHLRHAIVSRRSSGGGGSGSGSLGGFGSFDDSEIPAPLTDDVTPAGAVYDRLCSARSHGDCFRAVDALWRLAIVDPTDVASAPTAKHVSAIQRFISVAPRSSEDCALFRQLLHLLGNFAKLPGLSSALQAMLADTVTSGTFDLLRCEGHSSAPQSGEDTDVIRASVDLSILAYVQAVVDSSGLSDDHVLRWMPSLTGRLVPFVERAAEQCRSMLVDAPSQVDGTLPDELYLGCALQSARKDYAATASVAQRLLADLVASYDRLLSQEALPSLIALVQAVMRPCLTQLQQNPTMSKGRVAPSAIHFVPECARSVRPVTLAEASATLLDAAMASAQAAGFEAIPIADLLAAMPDVCRAVSTSMLDHLRALPARMLSYGCHTYSSFISICRDMPSFPVAAGRILVRPEEGTSEWEECAAALFLSSALRAATDDGADPPFDVVSAKAELPKLLLHRVDALGGADARTCSFLQLISAVSDRQAIGAVSAAVDTPQLVGVGAVSVAAVQVLAPHGKASISTWVNIMNGHAAAVRSATNEVDEDGERLITTADDATARARSQAETIASTLASAAALCAAAARLLERFPDLLGHFPQSIVMGLAEACFAAPSPAMVLESLARRFGVSLPPHGGLMSAFNGCVAWAAKMLRLFFRAGTASVFGPVDSGVFEMACAVVECDDSSTETKTAVLAAMRGIAAHESHEDLQESLEPHAASLFLASRCAGSEPTTLAFRAELCFSHKAANHAAAECGWTSHAIRSLGHAVTTMPLNVDCDERIAVTVAKGLSFAVSAAACPSAYPLQRSDAHSLAATLQRVSRTPNLRVTFLESCRRLACSSEGRNVLVIETPGHGLKPTVDQKSAFSRLVALTFFSSEAPSIVSVGMDAVAAACAEGGDDFAGPLVKMRVVESLEQLLRDAERRGKAPATGVMRLVASLSSCEGLQLQLGRRPELVTLVCDQARAETTVGTLALLTLRNLAFCSALKSQLCLDARMLAIFKAALFMLPDADPATVAAEENARLHRNYQRSPPPPAPDATMRYRRQELAGSAVWSLVHQNQRAKSYLRGALKASPEVTMEQLTEQVSSVEHLTSLPTYRPSMDRILDGLATCGLVAAVA